MRDCQPPGQEEASTTLRSASSISCAYMAARWRAARRFSRLLYEYGGSADRTVVMLPATLHTCQRDTRFNSMSHILNPERNDL